MKKMFCLALMMLFLAQASVAVGATVTPLKVAYNPATGNILGFIAIEKGFAAEEGVQLELVPFSNSTDALSALQAGKIDIAVSFGTAAPLVFVTKGADFTIFGGYVSGGMPVYARPDFEYKGLESFVSRKVAVARMYTPDIVWRGAMMRAGFDPQKDCTILEFKKPTDVLEAVKSGKADVGIGTNSTYLQSVAAGLKTLTWTNELDPMHVCCRPVGNTSWITESPDVVKAFLRAWIRAEAFLIDNQEECVKINQKYLKLDEAQSREMLLETNQVFESDPKGNGVRYMWELIGKLEYAKTDGLNIEDHLNATLYEEALRELRARDPENVRYKEFEERFARYNR